MKRKTLTALTFVQREEESEADSRALSLRLFRRLFRYTRPHARKRNWLLALVVIRAVQLPSLAWMLGIVMGGPVARMDLSGVLLGAAGYAVLAALTQFTLSFRSRLALELGEEIIYDLRNEMFAKLQTMPMSYFQRSRTGRLISRFTSDAESVRVGVQDAVFIAMVQGGQMLIAATIMLWYDAALFLVVLAMAPVLWGLNRLFRQRLSRAHRAMLESFSRVTATLAESVGGIRVIQGFVRQDVNAALFHDLVEDHSKYNMDVARASGVFLPLLEFKTQMFVAAVLVVGGWRVFHGLTSVENLYQFVLMASMFFGPVQSLGGLYTNALSAMAGAERVFKLLDAPPDWSDPADAVDVKDIRGCVEFRRVTFAYQPGRNVLRDIEFVAKPGQTVALVGHTGSGKTTIVNLISKFYLPTEGEVLIDGLNLRTLSSDALHRHMGIVLQQNFLFTGTVMDNIRFGNPKATDDEVREAARRLDCLETLENLPQGLLTRVGERGAGISLGQRQLICFARAMLANPSILILDEATSSVDTLTEARIQKALATLLKGRTSFVVAHRLSTIRNANQVLVLQHGRIVERGTHAELLRLNGPYAALYRQFIQIMDVDGE
jgi:ATP-binding cassette subfamily B protein